MSLDIAKIFRAIDLPLPEDDVFRLASECHQADKASTAHANAILSEVRLPLTSAHELHDKVKSAGLNSTKRLLTAMT